MAETKHKSTADQKEEAFERCLVRIAAGEELEVVLEQVPLWKDEFRGALEASQAVSWLAGTISVPGDAQERSRERFLLAARTARSQKPERYIKNLKHGKFDRFSVLALFRVVIYSFILLIIILAGVVSTVSASRNALPGEPLYPIKLFAEETRLWLERDATTRLAMVQDNDRERAREIKQLLNDASLEKNFIPKEVSLVGVFSRIQPDAWQVGENILVITPGTQIVGQLEDGLVIEVEGLLQEDGSILARRLETRQVELSGILSQPVQGIWAVGGVRFTITPQTVIQGKPGLNRQVVVVLVDRGNGLYEARLIKVEEDQGLTTPVENGNEDENINPSGLGREAQDKGSSKGETGQDQYSGGGKKGKE